VGTSDAPARAAHLYTTGASYRLGDTDISINSVAYGRCADRPTWMRRIDSKTGGQLNREATFPKLKYKASEACALAALAHESRRARARTANSVWLTRMHCIG
jgi:hypothetical protein